MEAQVNTSPKMILVKLLDGTEVYARTFVISTERISVEDFKYVTRENGHRRVKYLKNEKMGIHLDAVRVYLILHRGLNEIPEN